jgi:Domain of unknown function (DUF4159)
MKRYVIAAAVVLMAGLTATVFAQRGFGRFRLPEGVGAYPARYPPKDFEDGSFMICKLQYTSVRYEAMGIGWSTDYPYAGINLMIRMSELTRAHITQVGETGEPNYWVIRLTDNALFHCPILMGSDVGTMALSDEEAARLRQYLLKGGFLWVDDFWGTPAWMQWSEQIHKALPEYPIFDIPREHPIRHMLFPVDEIEQVTNINNWLRTHDTSERGDDSPHADFRGIADDKGRLMVVMTHNTDFGDTWERESESHEFFVQFSPKGYALGVDVLLYAMTH